MARAASVYQDKVTQVLNYIHQNLADDLSVNQLADLVHLSPFHFHRVYSSITGERLYETVSRMRMEKAVLMISKENERSLIDIAFDVGFENPSAFSRAFKKYFGFTPSDVQKRREGINSKISTLKSKYGKELSIQDLYPDYVTEGKGDCNMNVEVKNFDERPVIYLESDYTHDESMGAWMKLYQWYCENKGNAAKDWSTIGFYYSDPTVTPEDKCRSDLCLITPEKVDVSGAFKSKVVPSGKYAVARYVIKEEDKDKWTDPDFEAKDLDSFIQHFYKNWVVESGYEADDHPLLMAYNTAQDEPLQDSNGAPYFDVTSIDVILKLK